jgi:hypothetical protein
LIHFPCSFEISTVVHQIPRVVPTLQKAAFQGDIVNCVRIMRTSFPLGQAELRFPSDKSPGLRLGLPSTPSRISGEIQWHSVDFVPLTVAGQRRTLTGFLYLAAFPDLFSEADGGGSPVYAGSPAGCPLKSNQRYSICQ